VETHRADYAVVARMTVCLKRLPPGLHYEPANSRWECADGEFRAHGWRQARRIEVARRLIEEEDPQPSLFAMGRFRYRVWVTNPGLTPAGEGVGEAGATIGFPVPFSCQVRCSVARMVPDVEKECRGVP
jgi:hypothetical protein